MFQNTLAQRKIIYGTSTYGEPLCNQCKGRGMCGKPNCIFIERMKSVEPVVKKVKQDFFGASPPSVFIGRFGYPNIYAGTLAPMDDGDTSKYDAPKLWHGDNWDINKVLSHRTSLVNSRVKTNVKKVPKIIDTLKEIAMSKRSVDIEAHYSKPIQSGINFSGMTAPSGPAAMMETLKLTENPITPKKIEYVVSGDDFKATDAIEYLYKKHTDEGNITKLFSIGLLGEEKHRKLVPTRWAITAVDDALGKQLTNKIKQNPIINKPIFFKKNYAGNYFWIILFPKNWSYELIELWHPQSVWMQGKSVSISCDFENYFGRKKYASNTQGAYYAAKLAALEYLDKIKRQASVLIVREILPAYWAPLGVWVIRETVRGAFGEKAKDLGDNGVISQIENDLVCKKSRWQDKSLILTQIVKQKSIADY